MIVIIIVIFLIINYKLKMSTRILESIMAGEMCAFMDGFDWIYMMRSYLQRLLQHGLHVTVYICVKILKNYLKPSRKAGHTKKRLLLIYARRSYRQFRTEIAIVIGGEVSFANALSKIFGDHMLEEITKIVIVRTTLEQWQKLKKLFQYLTL